MLGSRSDDADHPAVEGRPCAVYPAIADPLAGWDLVQRDWGARQCERRARPVRTGWRRVASAIASRFVHPLRGEPELRTPCTCGHPK